MNATLTRDDYLGLVVYTPSSRYVYPAYEMASADLETPSGNNGSITIRTVY